MANRRGRPSLLREAVTRAICAHLELGIAFRTAAEAEGVSERLAHDWMAKGAEGVAPFDAFFTAVTRARARGEIVLHARVLEGGKGSDGARFFLERRFRDHYGLVERIEMKTETTNKVEHERWLEADVPDEFKAMAERALDALFGNVPSD